MAGTGGSDECPSARHTGVVRPERRPGTASAGRAQRPRCRGSHRATQHAHLSSLRPRLRTSFAFLGLVDERLASPRLATPRKQVPAGSLGIADRQTAIYPLVSPGGWNLIGRSPVRLFDRELDGFSLWQPGDRVRFVPIERAEFIRLGGDDTPFREASA